MILTGHLMVARCSLLGPGAGLPLAPGDGLLAATPGRTGLQAARCVLGRLLPQPMVLFLFLYFLFSFFTKIYFQYYNLQFCTPTALLGR